jgi:hypothetical protein
VTLSGHAAIVNPSPNILSSIAVGIVHRNANRGKEFSIPRGGADENPRPIAALAHSRWEFGTERECEAMKFGKVSKTALLGFTSLFAASAFAADQKTLELNNPVIVNGTLLEPGTYKFRWVGSGTNIQLSVLRGSRVVATAPAHEVELQRAPDYDADVVRRGSEGPGTLSAVMIRGKRRSVELDSPGGSVMEAAGASK